MLTQSSFFCVHCRISTAALDIIMAPNSEDLKHKDSIASSIDSHYRWVLNNNMEKTKEEPTHKKSEFVPPDGGFQVSLRRLGF